MFLALGDSTKKLIAILLVSLMLVIIGYTFWHQAPYSTTVAATVIRVTGSTTVFPLGTACAEAFNGNQSVYRVSVGQGGTGAGITDLGEGRSDIAMASREVTSDEKTKYGNNFQENLIGYDGIAVCVSNAIYNAGVTSLTKDQVKKIYAGNITNWKELGGPNDAIYIISREQGSGTRDSFLTDIFGSTKAETPAVSTYSSSNAEIYKAITGSDKAIGYLGYSYTQRGDIKAVKIEGVEVNPQTIKDKTYPLARKLYLDTLGDPKPGAKVFIEFCKGPEGQKIASENGFVPL